MNKYFYNLLFRSFDDSLDEEEQRRLDDALAKSEELRSSRQNFTDLREKLHSLDQGSFKPFFSERVIDRLRSGERIVIDFYLSAFRTVAVGAAILVVIFTSYNIGRTKALTIESALGIQRPTIEQMLTLEEPIQ